MTEQQTAPSEKDIAYAIKIVKNGGLIAYPTESVYGLGCDPYNAIAVARLREVKQRLFDLGLIVIASEWSQIEPLIAADLDPALRSKAEARWPGPVTWIFPAHEQAPEHLLGPNHTIALRISDHPIVRALCDHYQHPLVSSSANISGTLPARSAQAVKHVFHNKIDYILPGNVGKNALPTAIIDLISGKIVREG